MRCPLRIYVHIVDNGDSSELFSGLVYQRSRIVGLEQKRKPRSTCWKENVFKRQKKRLIFFFEHCRSGRRHWKRLITHMFENDEKTDLVFGYRRNNNVKRRETSGCFEKCGKPCLSLCDRLRRALSPVHVVARLVAGHIREPPLPPVMACPTRSGNSKGKDDRRVALIRDDGPCPYGGTGERRPARNDKRTA